jgi:hypothetical protein
MGKDKVVQEDVRKVVSKENFLKSKAFIAILSSAVSIVATSAVGYCFICLNDWRIENKTREELKEIFSYDVQVTVSDLNYFLKANPLAEMRKKIRAPNSTLNMTEYNTSVFDAYIQKISLLPKNNAKRILQFYKNLKIINEAKYILQNKNSNNPNDDEKWVIILHDAAEKSVKLGNDIIKNCAGIYVRDPNVSYWLDTSAASSTHTIK